MSLYIAFIDLTKAFDLVSRDGLFKVLPKIGCPPKLQSVIESFHTDTKGTVQFNGSFSEPFEIRSGVKQGCVLAPMLFATFFVLLLKHFLDTTTEEIYFRTRSDDRLFNLARLRAKTKRYARISSRTCCLLMTQQLRPTPKRNSCHWWTASHRPVMTSDWPSVWRRRMPWDRTHKHRRSLACSTTNSMLSASSPTSAPPSLTTSHWPQRSTRGLGRQLQLSLVARLECGQAPICLWRQIWRSTLPVLSAHCCMAERHELHYAGQESSFNTFHLISIRCIMGISWLDKVTNADVLFRAGLPSM